MNIRVIVTNPYLHIIPLPGLSFYASALIGVLVCAQVILKGRDSLRFLCTSSHLFSTTCCLGKPNVSALRVTSFELHVGIHGVTLPSLCDLDSDFR